jgi:F subunit of K+-transporting ATPase (Potass_KdpF)
LGKHNQVRGEGSQTLPFQNREICNAGRSYVVVHGRIFHCGLPLRQSLPEIEVIPMHRIMDLVGLIISILLLAYLTITMLYPEKF